MAAKAAIGEEKASASRVKLPVALLLIVVMLGVCLSLALAGGAAYFLVKSGKLPLASMSPASTASLPSDPAGRPMVLEPILVNLADEGGHAYLRLGLTLSVEGEATHPEGGSDANPSAAKDKAPTEEELAVRDTVLTVLGQQTSAWLLGPDGKEHLKIELKEALSRHNAQLKVKDIFFTDFLVQI